jgi:hypothetical protein
MVRRLLPPETIEAIAPDGPDRGTERALEAFVRAGAAMVMVTLKWTRICTDAAVIRQLGAAAGVALNPSTPVDQLRDVIGDLDLLLIASVNPGFGGQSFIPHSSRRSRRRALLRPPVHAALSVDGGVISNAAALVAHCASARRRHVGLGADPSAASRRCERLPGPPDSMAIDDDDSGAICGDGSDGRQYRELLRVVRGGSRRTASQLGWTHARWKAPA